MSTAIALNTSTRRELGEFHRNALTTHANRRVVDTGPHLLSVITARLPGAALVRRITVEEAMLLDHLGDDYASYRSDTARLLPGVW